MAYESTAHHHESHQEPLLRIKGRNFRFWGLYGFVALLCLCFLAGCVENEKDKLLNEKYEKNSLESFTYKEGMTVAGTIDQLATEIEKEGVYMIHLGFHPTTDNIADFEQMLRNDFDGEIEIFSRDGFMKPYCTISYHDFASFAWSPLKDTYGPVYYFEAKSPGRYSRGYSFRPKIRSNVAHTYSLYLQRVKSKAAIQNNSKKNIRKEGNVASGKELTIPARIARFDIKFEKGGRYIFYIGLRPTTGPTVKDYMDFTDVMLGDYDGHTEIYKDSEPYHLIRYDGSKTFGSGKAWSGHYKARGYHFNIDKPDMYSFIPEMKSKNEFEFSISTNRIMWRK